MALFVDIGQLSAKQSNMALGMIYKSIHEHGGDDSIWGKHPSLLIQRLIELFTTRGLDRLAAVQSDLIKWSSGENHKKGITPPRPSGAMNRWSSEELALVKIYLEHLPPALWTLDDHMMSVDFVVMRYLPADAMQTEAEWLSARAGMMGKVQANLEKQPTAKQADSLLAALPSTVAGAVQQFKLSPGTAQSLDFSRARSVENVRALSDGVRHKMRGVVLQHLEAEAIEPGSSSLQSLLLDEFATINRDWRRIAITEAGEAQLQGLIASLKPGTRVQRVEQYEDACTFCKTIDGRVLTVVESGKPNKDSDFEVWPGKNNMGRSASPRKRVGNILVEREPEEMWHLPAGLAHPNCRGRWVVLEDTAEPGDDPEFAKWLEKNLGS